ncbi:hypothetical protein M413DRAFT_447640 [Hebeloma cylindrosporum]|uniref:Adenylate kinase n=1 Tax=Hebeloma cylindrosporum TaxID=76867 RepID=A0A0C2XLT2_HEBCY|nr:hypothetical protein M413DRAFT_447640 [Hebeloma cylindrosporum h7]
MEIPSISNELPPLLGDGHGRYRVHLVGNSGSGKSTTGVVLAALLGVPYISMDTFMWEPGWGQAPPEVFRERLRAALDQDERGWVADGNYDRHGGLLAFEESTDVIWLDPPLLLYFPRIFLRTILRLLRLRPPCSPGCEERFMEVFFQMESILWWCLTNHWKNRAVNRARFEKIGVGVGTDTMGRRMRRFGGWGGALKRWLRDVEVMVRGNAKSD